MSDERHYLREQAAYIDVDPYAVAANANWFGITSCLELLALMATDGREGFAEVMAACDRFAATGELRAPDHLRDAYQARPVGALALAMAGRHFRDSDFGSSARLFRFAHALGTLEDQPWRFPRRMVQTNLAAGEHDFIRAAFAESPAMAEEHLSWIVRTELLSPAVRGADFDPQAWTASFNEIFAASGAAPITLRDAPGARFNGIAVADPDALPRRRRWWRRTPLVTVIMSVYAPDESLELAVRSILEQTWTELELLIVDDCSPPEFTETIDALAGLDPRIRVVHMPENGGTYKIRNHALQLAQGELVTFQDSDDWAHPERIARQATRLVRNRKLVADLSSSVRLTSDLTVNRVGYDATRINVSSLMFRRERVLAAMGSFDPVRKGADTEFLERLRVVFGARAIAEMPDVLAVVQLTSDSLSRGDFAYGWRSQDREVYTEGSRHWHTKIRARTASPLLDPAAPRPFPAPPRILSREPVDEIESDVIYVSDWRAPVNRYEGARRRVRALVDAGLQVQLAQAHHLRHGYQTRRKTAPEVLDMRAAGDVGWLIWSQPQHALLTVVDSPELLTFPRSPDDVQVRTDRLVVAAGTRARVPERNWTLYDPVVVERHGRLLFGVDVEWLPASEEIAADLRASGATGTILPARQIGVADVVPNDRSGPAGTGHLTLGVARIEGAERNRQTVDELLQCLPDAPAYDALIEDTKVVRKLLETFPTPASWTLVRGRLPELLAQLDVFMGFVPPAWGSAPSWPMHQALGAGCVLITHPRHEPALGDAALYAEPAQAKALLDSLIEDPEAFAAQRDRGLRHARTVLDPTSFGSYVAGLAGVAVTAT